MLKDVLGIVSAIKPSPTLWLDTGCGTGNLVALLSQSFAYTSFTLADPAENMIKEAKNKLAGSCKRYGFIVSDTENLPKKMNTKVDVITAILCHHYLKPEERKKALNACHELLNDGGVLVTIENSRPQTKEAVDIALHKWKSLQMSHGKSEQEAEENIQRFGVGYFPITINQQLDALKSSGFREPTLFRLTGVQAGFYAIK